jgi:hypothetical protein
MTRFKHNMSSVCMVKSILQKYIKTCSKNYFKNVTTVAMTRFKHNMSSVRMVKSILPKIYKYRKVSKLIKNSHNAI